jgi:hypothetical protein
MPRQRFLCSAQQQGTGALSAEQCTGCLLRICTLACEVLRVVAPATLQSVCRVEHRSKDSAAVGAVKRFAKQC